MHSTRSLTLETRRRDQLADLASALLFSEIARNSQTKSRISELYVRFF